MGQRSDTRAAGPDPHTLRLAVLFGGPSDERGISLNSARSLIDHLQSDRIEIHPIYFDRERRAHRLDPRHIYSATPDDFDFKLPEVAEALSDEGLTRALGAVDLAFPAVHGAFGEDGALQETLERRQVAFVGCSSRACRAAFNKVRANQRLEEAGYAVLPYLGATTDRHAAAEEVERLLAAGGGRVVVKPANGGSSLGVNIATDAGEALRGTRELLESGVDDEVILEAYCDGREFTVLVVPSESGEPTALIPTQVSIERAEGSDDFFDYRRKYLPTAETRLLTPPDFETEEVQEIRRGAQAIFALFEMTDFARIDGWIWSDGTICFSDINPISGMEQNSFLFQQAAHAGMAHEDVLRLILRNACARYGLERDLYRERAAEAGERRPVNILFGGGSSERNVSVMSGTNVWLKLRRSEQYRPESYLLAPDHTVYPLPYAHNLLHTVEEIVHEASRAARVRRKFEAIDAEIRSRLALPDGESGASAEPKEPLSLERFIAESSLVFNAVHGDIGESGRLQEMLEAAGVAYTGSGPAASRLCMDKSTTGEALAGLEEHGISVAAKEPFETASLEDDESAAGRLWDSLPGRLGSETIIVKPAADGCSTGIARLASADDLEVYLEHLRDGSRIAEDELSLPHGIVEMPGKTPARLLFERFIETDQPRIADGKLEWSRRSGWVEITVGVRGPSGSMRAMTPSIAVASGEILSLEEKFQGGTGINITPPPRELVSAESLRACRERIERVALRLGLSGFARIDAFMEVTSGRILVIEVNTIPGMTPSTVLFHQALAEEPPMTQREFFEMILGLSGGTRGARAAPGPRDS